ncbi:MAG: peptidase phage prohead [Xanthobacteraceae bacterium]|jgi:hypothetical protein|nr:peptidase phage prohead [Xanthobacteraceae bacterium]
MDPTPINERPAQGVSAGDIATLPMQRLQAPIVEGSVRAEARTVDVVFTTGASVRRRRWIGWDDHVDFDEILVVSREAVNLERFERGGPVLDSHNTWSTRAQIAVVERAWIENGRGYATIRFPTAGIDPEADRFFALVQDKQRQNISVGYSIDEVRIERGERRDEIEKWFVERWTPYEISFVTVGADARAQVRSMAGSDAPKFPLSFNRATPTTSEVPMTTPIPAGSEPAPTTTRSEPPAPAPVVTPPSPLPAEEHAWRAADITKLQQRSEAFGLTAAEAITVMGQHRTLEAATDALQNLAATRNAPRQQPHIQIVTDEGDTLRSAVENVVAARANPQATKLTDAGRQYRGMSLMELGRTFVEESQGVRLRNLGKMEMASVLLGLTRAAGMQSTSDFPNILANVAGKRLRDSYQEAPRLWKLISRQSNAPDFKEKVVVQLAGIPELQKVREGGEYTYAKLGESAEKYSIATYGRIIAITRQVIINDDLGAFDRLPALFGRAAAELENDLVWGILVSNPVMADGIPLFHADHGNLAAAGAAPSETTFEAAETALGDQKDAASKPLNLSFSYFVGPQKYSVAVKKLLTSVQATKTGDVNVYQNAVEPIIENRLKPAAGAAPWFMSVDPGRWDTIEYSYLEGEEGLYTEERIGFEVDGVEVKGRLDFGAKAIDFRGLYKNPGI